MYANGESMVEFGQELRREREFRGILLDAVCAVTKVSVRHVEALEAGHIEELPGGVFRKGIVRSYLAAIGLDVATWMDRFESCLQASGMASAPDQTEWAAFAQNVQRNRAASASPTGMRWLGVVLMLLALLVCGWLAWRYVLRDRFNVSSQRTALRRLSQEQTLPRA